jgi:trans-2-enoyl-CoA reductase
MEGTYGTLPALPAVIGNEAVGIVEAVGAKVLGWAVGDVALPLAPGGLWSEWLCLAASTAVKLPNEIELSQAAMLRVNPATAWLMLHDYLDLQAGDWIVQNAANSTVGLSVMQLAKSQGWRVLNLVRREAAAEQCRAAGAEFVLVEDAADFTAQAGAILGGKKARLALNAVGGESALRLANLLGFGGTHVTYGAMSRQKLSLPNRLLLFQQLTFTGFWLSRWANEASPEKQCALYQSLAAQMVSGNLRLAVNQIYPVEEITPAIVHAQQSERSGKILLRW